jgi:hypothetical protein
MSQAWQSYQALVGQGQPTFCVARAQCKRLKKGKELGEATFILKNELQYIILPV